MPNDFLLEIGLEEMPARFIPNASAQLEDKVRQFLEQHRIPYESLQSFSTPRRLALIVTNMASKQEDLKEELRGPAKRIAVDDEGNWSKAAIGFARGKGLTAEDLYMQEVNGEQFVFVRKHEVGKDTIEILPELSTVISSMSFPKNMRWGSEELRFVRPIRWLVALYGSHIIPMTIAAVTSGRTTYGHRFLGAAVGLERPEQYVSLLEQQYCIVNPAEREKRILDQITKIKESHAEWEIAPDQELLTELVNLVEYPTAFIGSFAESYLEVPSEVLTTSMRVNQRYIVVESMGKLLPFFIGVRNGDDRSIDQVVKGNEKVLSARLADARFFYEEDQKLTIDQYNERLETVVWHEELGSMADKVRRIRELSGEWAEVLKLENKKVDLIDRAASICKFDLVTLMVYEFPELQGLMGDYYAQKFGEAPEVARAIREHYYPLSSGGQSPTDDIGSLVAIADKIDTIVGSFLIGIIPTGSQDPYGLRRAAQGIVQILIEMKIDLTLDQLFKSSLSIYRKLYNLSKTDAEVLEELRQFFGLRVKNILQDQGIRYDIIDALLPLISGNLEELIQKADVFQARVEQGEFKKAVEAFNRVGNLAKKADTIELVTSDLTEEAEKMLWEQYTRVRQLTEKEMQDGNFGEALNQLASLQPAIDTFFDQVMVMVEDEKLRQARLALLKQLSNLFNTFADFSKLIFP